MDKQIELSKQQKSEDKFLIANVLDKIKLSNNKNKIETTNFFDLREQAIIEEVLGKRKQKNYKLYGGYNSAERRILIAFSDNINIDYNDFLSIIRINLPNNLKGGYEHKNYLGGLMKLGIKREKVGDIIVRNDGADIIIKRDIAKYIMENIVCLTRFEKSKIEQKNIEDIIYVEPKKEIIKINVPSMRLDCIVGELAKCSRGDSIKYLNEERVFVNFKEELRPSKNVEEGDYITIRGKGRFKIDKILGTTKSGRLSIQIEK